MTISGFTMVKNADKLYYPIKQAIMSILPIVDEFVVALGDCDEGDKTRQIIESINDDKVKIIDTVWDLKKFLKGTENAHQTDIAKENCKGDWLFYLQADEVIHEKYLENIKACCEKNLDRKEVEGIIFKYKHFWGDYEHYHNSHGWYNHEIRIVRNDKDIHSWESAQSFRRIPNFDYVNYRQQEGTFMLKVVEVDAYVYHYGWVRPPRLMKNKYKALANIHSENTDKIEEPEYDYGLLNKLPVFNETHPSVMDEWIKDFDWKDKLQYSGKRNKDRKPHKHEKIKYIIATFLKRKVFRNESMWDFRNYLLLKD
ncbi:MAG: glycosyltransferase family 2 protein [Saprospiraceae bacterium]|nr:glycosyltransferase family 2 protein [Saprospiraceae bacterium]